MRSGLILRLRSLRLFPEPFLFPDEFGFPAAGPERASYQEVREASEGMNALPIAPKRMPQLVVNLAERRRFRCWRQPAAFGAKIEFPTFDAISSRRK